MTECEKCGMVGKEAPVILVDHALEGSRVGLYKESTHSAILGLEGRLTEWARQRIKTLATPEIWRDVPSARVRGIPYGVADRMGQIGTPGNGQVPIVAASAFRILSGGVI
jgi:hypothetical protein